MSGLREIIEWIEREIILNPENSIDTEYEEISRIFERDNRSSLDHILRGDKEEFLDFLGSRLSELRDEPETDEEIGGFEQRLDVVEQGIEELSKGVARSLNILGTPFFEIEEEARSVFDRIKGFFGF